MGGGGGHIVSPLSVRTYVRNGFHSIFFESIGVLNSYFIHSYVVIKYRSSSMLGKIRLLLWELWPFFDLCFYEKMVSVQYFL